LLTIALFLFGASLLDLLELKTYDMRLRALASPPPRQVTIAAIDERSLAELGRWPWSRATLATLVDQLDRLGARVIAFDVFFPEPESKQADRQFARAVGAGRKVVLGTVFLLDREEARHLGAERLEAARRSMVAHAIDDVKASGDPGAEFRMQEPLGVLANIPELQKSAAYAGHINVLPDVDGVVRRAPLVFRYEGRYFPSFDVQVVRAFLDAQTLAVHTAPYGLTGIEIGGRIVPTDEDGRLLVRYRGREGTFDAVSISDILAGHADPALLRERVVLIGTTAKAVGDVRVTPYSEAYPGVEVRASIIESLIEGAVLRHPEWMKIVDVAAILALGLGLTFLLPRLGVTSGAMLALGVAAAYLFFAGHMFRTEGLWLNVVYPMLLVGLLFVSTTLVHYFAIESEKRYLKAAFQHYVPPAVVDEIVADADRLKLGGEKRELTVLFSDIRGFTAVSETAAPEDLVKLLNVYLTQMTNVVFEHKGSLDKYVGDALMAVFGAPIAEADHARLACRAALDMVRALPALQARWQRDGLPQLDIGIGINTGPMIVGNMGSESRFNYTVIGDAVNLASRIESLNKVYGTNILVSEYTFAQVKDAFPNSREIDRVQVRGRAQHVRLYELIPEGRYADLRWLGEFGNAYALLHGGDLEGAAECFDALHTSTGDPVSAYHARACRTANSSTALNSQNEG
jgi:adenylate cyclase